MLGGVLERTLEESGKVVPGEREFAWIARGSFEILLAANKDAVGPDPEDEPAAEPAGDDEDGDDNLDEEGGDDEAEEGRELDDDLIDLDDEWDEKDSEDDDKHDSPRKFYE